MQRGFGDAENQGLPADDADLLKAVRSTVTGLSLLWDSIHLDAATREERLGTARNRLFAFLQDIVKEEAIVVQAVGRDIVQGRMEVARLRKLFKVGSQFSEAGFPPGSLQLLKALKAEEIQLRESMEKAVVVQSGLYDQLKLLCGRVQTEVPALEGIYSEKQLTEIRNTIKGLDKVLVQRMEQVLELQAETRGIYTTLGTNSDLSAEDLELLQRDFDTPDAVISKEVVEKCITLNRKLMDQYDEWAEKLAFRYDELLVKLDGLSNKCFPGGRESDNGIDFSAANRDNKTLQLLEAEVEQMEDRYQRGKPIFEKLNLFMSLWKEKLSAEQSACRASFYRNRGGSINDKVKRQKQLTLLIPKALLELQSTVSSYIDEGHAREDILIGQLLPHEYAESVMTEYQKDKEMERAQKQMAKKKPAAPVKSVFSTAASHTGQLKNRKETKAVVEPTPETRQSRKRSISLSQMSNISPTRTPARGPKTSSPKTRDDLSTTSSTINSSSSFAKQSAKSMKRNGQGR